MSSVGTALRLLLLALAATLCLQRAAAQSQEGRGRLQSAVQARMEARVDGRKVADTRYATQEMQWARLEQKVAEVEVGVDEVTPRRVVQAAEAAVTRPARARRGAERFVYEYY